SSKLFGLVLALMSTFAGRALAEINWPEFRGPRGDGTTDATGLALHWTERASGADGDKGIRWKTPIHGKAWSSPVVWGEQIWVTSATEDGHELYALCLERDSGKILRDLRLFHVEHPQAAHDFNSYASPTPAIESGRIYVTFGAH